MSVCAGHEALIIAAADVSSFFESGASGCMATPVVARDDGVSATTSVDMLMLCEWNLSRSRNKDWKRSVFESHLSRG